MSLWSWGDRIEPIPPSVAASYGLVSVGCPRRRVRLDFGFDES